MTIYGWIWARFYPDTSDGGSPSGLNLHACLRTKEHAAVWFQGRKKTQVRRWYIYIAHKVTKLKHNRNKCWWSMIETTALLQTTAHGERNEERDWIFHWATFSHDSPALPCRVGPDCEWEELDSWQVDEELNFLAVQTSRLRALHLNPLMKMSLRQDGCKHVRLCAE